MLIPTAVAAAAIITSCCWLTMRSLQKALASPVRASTSEKVAAGCERSERSGTKPPRISPVGSPPSLVSKVMTTPKKERTTTPTIAFKMPSKIFTPLAPESYCQITAVAIPRIKAQQITLPVSPPRSSGKRFCCSAAVPRANCGRLHTTFAIATARIQPQPSTGFTCSLIAWKGRLPVESVT